MAPAVDTPPSGQREPRPRLRRDVLNSVTVISARVGMIRRTVGRSDSMTDAERDRLLADAAAIHAAVLAVCAVGDGIGGDSGAAPNGRP